MTRGKPMAPGDGHSPVSWAQMGARDSASLGTLCYNLRYRDEMGSRRGRANKRMRADP